ncbi:nudC domain-containing protein 1 [Hydra vulgaris]|uniref:NudC domain-containing protein 1 n=1 Tax=Hydra vulgaris TaxID=6087 RepID=T2M6X4_HYDVU|nr:nudC domain-containing protein 1 [Hydra vulgaris]
MSELHPNKALLNNKFNGYKLASESLAYFSYPHVSPVPTKDYFESDSFSYIFLRSYGFQNRLFIDSFNDEFVYFTDNSYNIYVYSPNEVVPRKVFQIASSSELNLKLECSIVFATEHVTLVNNGSGAIYLVYTKNLRNVVCQWDSEASILIHDFKLPSVINKAYFDKEKNIFHAFVSTLKEIKHNEVKKTYVILQWLQFTYDFNSCSEVINIKMFISKSLPYAFWTNADSSKLYVASDRKFHLVENNTLEFKEPTELSMDVSEEQYVWSQNKECLTITFKKSVEKTNVSCLIKKSYLSVELLNGSVLLQGDLERDIDIELSSWSIVDKQLEVVLWKNTPGVFWHCPVPSDNNGVHQVTGDEEDNINEFSQKLDYLTTSTLTDDIENSNFNMQQLEDCDSNIDDEIAVYSINVATGQVDTEINLVGHQWLFQYQDNPISVPLLCLRHDVDGILWRPNELSPDSTWQHVATFDALGYVQASKREHKFTLCTPLYQYAIITDCTSNIYIYEQDLDNKVTHKQFIVSLGNCSRIFGCQASKTRIFVLTDEHLNVIQLPQYFEDMQIE